MSDHISGPRALAEPVADITDVYAFPSPDRPGRLVMVMTHPAFRIPRQSGWGFDENRKLTYRRIDRYLTPLSVPRKPYPGQTGVSISFHRPISAYINGLAGYGLVTDALHEIPSYKAEGETENPAEKEIPLFMSLRARKIKLSD